jgi:hypothetical protein
MEVVENGLWETSLAVKHGFGFVGACAGSLVSLIASIPHWLSQWIDTWPCWAPRAGGARQARDVELGLM